MIEYLIPGGIILLGIIISLYFLLKKRYRTPHVAENYERIREKLTLREEEPEEDEESYDNISSGGFSIEGFIGGFIVILIGVFMIGLIAEQVNLAISQMNMKTPASSISQAMLSSIPWFFGIALLGIVIAIIYNSPRIGNVGVC